MLPVLAEELESNPYCHTSYHRQCDDAEGGIEGLAANKLMAGLRLPDEGRCDIFTSTCKLRSQCFGQ